MDVIQQKIIDIIDQHAQEIIDYADDIFNHAELGFKETRTAKKTADAWRKMGLQVEEDMALTGVCATLAGTTEKDFTITAIGELDAVICPSHPNADPVTGAAHVCGHNAQLAAILGASIALTDPEIAQELGGNVQFVAVPAEEYLEGEFRQSLIQEGKLKFAGGKSEFLYRGYFDHTDIALCHHMHSDQDWPVELLLGSTATNGFITKHISIQGKAVHAGACPELGINALNAAALGFQALAFARETFKDSDFVRVHPVITQASNAVNVVPERVEIESMVRAKTLEAITDASYKMDRAYTGAAYAIGAEIDITDGPGYLPALYLKSASTMDEAAALVCPEGQIAHANPLQQDTYSTDIGDLMHVVPTLYFSSGGFTGSAHSADFRVTNPVTAYVLPAKVMALNIYNILKNNAEQGKEIVKNPDYKAKMTLDEYKTYMAQFESKK